jgi:hypothetical protein
MHHLNIGEIAITLPWRDVMEDEDRIPRDLTALIVLHALLSNVTDHGIGSPIAAKYADLAYTVADELIARGEK